MRDPALSSARLLLEPLIATDLCGRILACECHAVISTSGNRDHIRQVRWNVALTSGVETPGNHITVILKGEGVIVAGGDGNDVCQSSRHLAERMTVSTHETTVPSLFKATL